MWKLKNDGEFAENEETGTTLKMDYGRDGLIRVKKNYKTIAIFEKVPSAKEFIANYVNKMNGAD